MQDRSEADRTERDTRRARGGLPRLGRPFAAMLGAGLAVAYVVIGVSWIVPDWGDSSRMGMSLTAAAFFARTFTFHAGVVCLVFAGLALLGGRRRLAVSALPLLLFAMWPAAWSWVRPRHEPNPRADSLTVMTLNTQVGFADASATLAAVRAADPDVLVVVEYWRAIDEILPGAMRETHPHQLCVIGDDAFGMAIFSKFPMLDRRPYPDLGVRLREPQVRVVLDVRGEEVVVQGVHALPPVSLEYVREQRRLIAALAAWSEREPRTVILAGDFNCAPEAERMRAFRRLSFENAHADAGRGRGSTWPAKGVLSWLPGVRIDHVLVRSAGYRGEKPGSLGGWRVTACRTTSGATGSDHRGVVARLER